MMKPEGFGFHCKKHHEIELQSCYVALCHILLIHRYAWEGKPLSQGYNRSFHPRHSHFRQNSNCIRIVSRFEWNKRNERITSYVWAIYQEMQTAQCLCTPIENWLPLHFRFLSSRWICAFHLEFPSRPNRELRRVQILVWKTSETTNLPTRGEAGRRLCSPSVFRSYPSLGAETRWWGDCWPRAECTAPNEEVNSELKMGKNNTS